jgi:hypothetical protein
MTNSDGSSAVGADPCTWYTGDHADHVNDLLCMSTWLRLSQELP